MESPCIKQKNIREDLSAGKTPTKMRKTGWEIKKRECLTPVLGKKQKEIDFENFHTENCESLSPGSPHFSFKYNQTQTKPVNLLRIEKYFIDVSSSIFNQGQIDPILLSNVVKMQILLQNCLNQIPNLSLQFYVLMASALKEIQQISQNQNSNLYKTLQKKLFQIGYLIENDCFYENIEKIETQPSEKTGSNKKYNNIDDLFDLGKSLILKISKVSKKVLENWKKNILPQREPALISCGFLLLYCEVDKKLLISPSERIPLEKSINIMKCYLEDCDHVIKIVRKTKEYVEKEMISVETIQRINDLLTKITVEQIQNYDKKGNAIILYELIACTLKYYEIYAKKYYDIDIFENSSLDSIDFNRFKTEEIEENSEEYEEFEVTLHKNQDFQEKIENNLHISEKKEDKLEYQSQNLQSDFEKKLSQYENIENKDEEIKNCFEESKIEENNQNEKEFMLKLNLFPIFHEPDIIKAEEFTDRKPNLTERNQNYEKTFKKEKKIYEKSTVSSLNKIKSTKKLVPKSIKVNNSTTNLKFSQSKSNQSIISQKTSISSLTNSKLSETNTKKVFSPILKTHKQPISQSPVPKSSSQIKISAKKLHDNSDSNSSYKITVSDLENSIIQATKILNSPESPINLYKISPIRNRLNSSNPKSEENSPSPNNIIEEMHYQQIIEEKFRHFLIEKLSKEWEKLTKRGAIKSDARNLNEVRALHNKNLWINEFEKKNSPIKFNYIKKLKNEKRFTAELIRAQKQLETLQKFSKPF